MSHVFKVMEVGRLKIKLLIMIHDSFPILPRRNEAPKIRVLQFSVCSFNSPNRFTYCTGRIKREHLQRNNNEQLISFQKHVSTEQYSVTVSKYNRVVLCLFTATISACMISSTQRPPTDRLRLRVIWVIAQLGNRSYTERAKNHVQSPAEELALGCVYSLRQKQTGCVITQPRARCFAELKAGSKCHPSCSFITVPMFELSKSHLVTLYFPHLCVQ